MYKTETPFTYDGNSWPTIDWTFMPTNVQIVRDTPSLYYDVMTFRSTDQPHRRVTKADWPLVHLIPDISLPDIQTLTRIQKGQLGRPSLPRRCDSANIKTVGNRERVPHYNFYSCPGCPYPVASSAYAHAHHLTSGCWTFYAILKSSCSFCFTDHATPNKLSNM